MPAIRRSGIVWFLALAVGGLALDLATKSWLFNWLGLPRQSPPSWIVPRFFCLETSLNEGALFGFGQGMGWLFISLSFVAAAGILYWLLWGGASRDLWLAVALGGIVGGIFGNLYDRLGLPAWEREWVWPYHVVREVENENGQIEKVVIHEPGDPIYAVRDWLHVQYEGHWDYPIFNIADMLLVGGVGMLFIHAWWLEPRRAKRKQAEEAGKGGAAARKGGGKA